MADARPLVGPIAALPPTALQSQLLLLRFCAGPRANYSQLSLPLVAGACLAAALDRDSVAAALGLLSDARDTAAKRDALATRLPLPVAKQGLGIGGRTRIVPAGSLASWVDTLRARRATSPPLHLAVALSRGRPAKSREAVPPGWVEAAAARAAVASQPHQGWML